MVAKTIAAVVVLAAMYFVMLDLGWSMAETITTLVMLATLMVVLAGLGFQLVKELRHSDSRRDKGSGSTD